MLSAISPSEVSAAELGFTLTVHGGGFTDSSVVWVGGRARPTRFVTPQALMATLDPGDRSEPAELPVFVVTPPPGGGTSDTLWLTVAEPPVTTEPAPVPTLTHSIPAMALAGEQSFWIAIYGTGFTAATVARWNGSNLPTTVIKESRLLASLRASDLAAAGSADLTAFTPAPGGGLAAAIPFAIVPRGGAHPQAWNVDAIPVVEAVRHVAIGPDGTIYAARTGSDSILRANAGTAANLGSFGAAGRPDEIVVSASGATAYVGNSGSGSIGVFATGTATSVATYALPAPPVRLRLSPDESRLYVTTSAGRLEVLDAASGTIVASVALAGVGSGLAVAPDGSSLWVSSQVAATIQEISAATLAVVRTLAAPGAPQDALVTADGARLFVANEGGWVEAIDVATLGRTEIAVPGAFGLALTPDGTQLWVTQASLGRITMLDAATLQVVGRLHVTGTPRYLGFTADGRAAVVANEAGSLQIIQ